MRYTIDLLHEFTKTASNYSLLERIIGQSMNLLLMIGGKCAGFRATCAHFSGHLPIKRCNGNLGGNLGEGSDKSSPIIGFSAQCSNRRGTICSSSRLSETAHGNSSCRFLLKNDLSSCKTSDHGNLFEPSSTKHLGESSNTEAIHAHFCSNIGPIYHKSRSARLRIALNHKRPMRKSPLSRRSLRSTCPRCP